MNKFKLMVKFIDDDSEVLNLLSRIAENIEVGNLVSQIEMDRTSKKIEIFCKDLLSLAIMKQYLVVKSKSKLQISLYNYIS